MKRNRRIVNILLATLMFAIPFGTAACATQQHEHQLHTHTYSTEWDAGEKYHWHAATCCPTTAGEYGEHTFGADGNCTVCGYTQPEPHTHTYSTEWSSSSIGHWHTATCCAAAASGDYGEHTFNSNNYCTTCGYDRLPNSMDLPQTDFIDMGEKFDTVVAPLCNAAETILQDLVESGDVALDAKRNPRIVNVRYTYGLSFIITIREDIFIEHDLDNKSEFLYKETGIELEDFGEHYDATFLAYSNFLNAERKSQGREDYEEFILPYAERSADLIMAQYESYKDRKHITFLNHGKALILSADSRLSETYDNIVENLNYALEKRGYPLITDQDLDISFGGNITWEIVNKWINIQTNIGDLHYNFYLSFNADGRFTEDTINYYMGTRYTGYTPKDPDDYNPDNEEYADFFADLKIEEIDLSVVATTYKYDGNGNALYAPIGEDTWLYF